MTTKYAARPAAEVVNVRNYIQQLNQKVHYHGCVDLLNAVQCWKEVEAQKRDFTPADSPMKWFREGYRHLFGLSYDDATYISDSHRIGKRPVIPPCK